MSEEKICRCSHVWADHTYEMMENGKVCNCFHCTKCGKDQNGNWICQDFCRPGSITPEARKSKKAEKEQKEQEQKVIDQQANQRREEGRRKYAEIEAKKETEKPKGVLPKGYDANTTSTENTPSTEVDKQKKNYSAHNSAHILGPLHAGIYYGKRRNREEHDNHRLSQLLYRNKRYNPSDPELTKEEINEICDPMLSVLPHKLAKIIIPVPNIRQGRLSETKCALSIAAGLAAMINCNSYNDVLVRISKTKHGNSISERQEAAERDYDVAEYIKTAENSIIKDEIVLLIDDITTSGNTAKKCANLLVSYGAKQVIILCAAETKLS
jgi:hypothetical protein